MGQSIWHVPVTDLACVALGGIPLIYQAAGVIEIESTIDDKNSCVLYMASKNETDIATPVYVVSTPVK